MQKGKPMEDIPACRNCGAVKFKRRMQLSKEEWEIAQRFVRDKSVTRPTSLFCARCLRPRPDDSSIA